MYSYYYYFIVMYNILKILIISVNREGALGDILVIISTVAYAAYVVGQEVSTKATQDASQVLLWAMFITAIMLTSISLIFEPEEWSTVLYQPWGAYATVFYSAVVTTCICYGFVVVFDVL